MKNKTTLERNYADVDITKKVYKNSVGKLKKNHKRKKILHLVLVEKRATTPAEKSVDPT